MDNIFSLERFVISCNLMKSLIDESHLEVNDWTNPNNYDKSNLVIYKGSFIDCIESMYSTVPGVLCICLKKLYQIEKVECKNRFGIYGLHQIEEASWLKILSLAKKKRIISPKDFNNYKEIIDMRGELIHSFSLSKESYYNLINNIIVSIKELDLDKFEDKIVSSYRNCYSDSKVSAYSMSGSNIYKL